MHTIQLSSEDLDDLVVLLDFAGNAAIKALEGSGLTEGQRKALLQVTTTSMSLIDKLSEQVELSDSLDEELEQLSDVPNKDELH